MEDSNLLFVIALINLDVAPLLLQEENWKHHAWFFTLCTANSVIERSYRCQ